MEIRDYSFVRSASPRESAKKYKRYKEQENVSVFQSMLIYKFQNKMKRWNNKNSNKKNFLRPLILKNISLILQSKALNPTKSGVIISGIYKDPPPARPC